MDQVTEQEPALTASKLKVGDKVYYQPSHYKVDQWENGIIKEIRPDTTDSVWVVYNCSEDWDNYKNYKSAKTTLSDLTAGWKTKLESCPDCSDEGVIMELGFGIGDAPRYYQVQCEFCHTVDNSVFNYNKMISRLKGEHLE